MSKKTKQNQEEELNYVLLNSSLEEGTFDMMATFQYYTFNRLFVIN